MSILTKDFDNVNNLIDAPEHQEKIAELRAAMRAEMLKTYDVVSLL